MTVQVAERVLEEAIERGLLRSGPDAEDSSAAVRETAGPYDVGVVENIDTTSRQLKKALEAGKTIIVTTLQKFPVIAREIGQLPGRDG